MMIEKLNTFFNVDVKTKKHHVVFIHINDYSGIICCTNERYISKLSENLDDSFYSFVKQIT